VAIRPFEGPATGKPPALPEDGYWQLMDSGMPSVEGEIPQALVAPAIAKRTLRFRLRNLADFVLSQMRGLRIMIPNGKSLESKVDLEEPLENQPLEWAEEDREMEDRKPDLGEIEEDTSGV
jgi:hypothetical protein